MKYWHWRHRCDHCEQMHPSASCPTLKRRAVTETLNGVRVSASVRLDVNAMQRELSAEQIAAVMEGLGRCIATASASDPEPPGEAP